MALFAAGFPIDWDEKLCCSPELVRFFWLDIRLQRLIVLNHLRSFSELVGIHFLLFEMELTTYSSMLPAHACLSLWLIGNPAAPGIRAGPERLAFLRPAPSGELGRYGFRELCLFLGSECSGICKKKLSHKTSFSKALRIETANNR
jgi:hypothetical protein